MIRLPKLRWYHAQAHYNGDRPWLKRTGYNAAVRGFGTYGNGNSRWKRLASVKAFWNLCFGHKLWWN